MQKNTLIAVVVLILVAAAGYFLITKYPMQGDVAGEDNQAVVPTGDRAVAGPVTAIDLEGAMVDGPYRFTIMTSSNEMVEVAIPSMGILLCAAKDSIADVTTISVGQTIEVRGTVGEEGVIIPCESAEHYFRVAVDQKG